MGCACGATKKAFNKFKISPETVNGFYYIDLCGGYKLKYNQSVYYLVVIESEEHLSTTEQGIKDWALENCNIVL